MRDGPQIGKSAPNFLTVGVYKKKLGKIRLSDESLYDGQWNKYNLKDGKGV